MFCHAWNPSKIREPSYHNFRLSSMLESASVHYVECWQLWLVQLPETLGLYCTMSLLHFWCESLVGISDLLQIHRHMNVTKIIYWWGSLRLLNIFFLLSATFCFDNKKSHFSVCAQNLGGLCVIWHALPTVAFRITTAQCCFWRLAV